MLNLKLREVLERLLSKTRPCNISKDNKEMLSRENSERKCSNILNGGYLWAEIEVVFYPFRDHDTLSP